MVLPAGWQLLGRELFLLPEGEQAPVDIVSELVDMSSTTGDLVFYIPKVPVGAWRFRASAGPVQGAGGALGRMFFRAPDSDQLDVQRFGFDDVTGSAPFPAASELEFPVRVASESNIRITVALSSTSPAPRRWRSFRSLLVSFERVPDLRRGEKDLSGIVNYGVLRALHMGSTAIALSLDRRDLSDRIRFQIGVAGQRTDVSTGLSNPLRTLNVFGGLSYPEAMFTRMDPETDYVVGAALYQLSNGTETIEDWSFLNVRTQPLRRGAPFQRMQAGMWAALGATLGECVVLDGKPMQGLVGDIEDALFQLNDQNVLVATERGLVVRINMFDRDGRFLLPRVPVPWTFAAVGARDTSPSYVAIRDELYRVTRRFWDGENEMLMVCNPATAVSGVLAPDWWTL